MEFQRPALNFDNWGNLIVWLPIGKPCTITDPDRQYTVTSRDISDYRSIKTAIGLPIYVGHPDVAITPKNNLPSVGTALSDIRETPEGGVEIECKITDDETIARVVNRELTEVSPGYDVLEGVRVYNHLAIIPDGYAKGGRQMQIQLESLDRPIAAIDPIDNPTINKNNMSLTAEDITAITEAMGSYFKKMEAVEAVEEAAKCEGFKEGLSQAKWLTIAREKGYTGADPLAAKEHILKESYPAEVVKDLSAETIEGLLIAASLKVEAKPVETKPAAPEVVVPKVTIESNDAPAQTSRYRSYNKIKK
jgi:phage FluMu protein gp41